MSCSPLVWSVTSGGSLILERRAELCNQYSIENVDKLQGGNIYNTQRYVGNMTIQMQPSSGEKSPKESNSELRQIKPQTGNSTRQKLHQCGKCSMQFGRPGQLREHIILVHNGGKPFRCEECGKHFTTLKILKRHIKNHTGEKPHQCKHCSKSFAQSANLARHVLTHTGERPYGCGECGKQFTQLANLKDHMRTHTGEKPYHCDECNEQFTTLSHLKGHIMRTHDRERLHYCDHGKCNRSFSEVADLIKHHQLWHGTKGTASDD
ncbi:PREDICTED: zinc finger protein 239-like [Branchiostoma belcheri]|uniref:Zinc finger protein 239-like n=1 Tax=Branchiostoma belcheri TaxID=7741 RepID=A0A6P4YQ90_BRABE|nr:PREDICTED: zinc finger protein 239-like [Branchiostoma belcheri]